MNITDIMEPGRRVDIEKLGNYAGNDELKKISHITKVYDIPDDDTIEIVMPMDHGKMIVLDVGDEYKLFLYAKKGLYSCETEVIDRRNDANVSVAVLAINTDVVKVQRREFFRFDCIMGMTARELGDLEAQNYMNTHVLNTMVDPTEKCVIMDISGGGMKFVSAAHFKKGGLVHVRFIMNVRGENKKYDVVVRLLYVDPSAANPRNTEYRGEFLFLDGGDREDIIKFIFDEQRKARRHQTGS
jgi:c-di-GMP-binding flagellar brake protein YcgR